MVIDVSDMINKTELLSREGSSSCTAEKGNDHTEMQWFIESFQCAVDSLLPVFRLPNKSYPKFTFYTSMEARSYLFSIAIMSYLRNLI